MSNGAGNPDLDRLLSISMRSPRCSRRAGLRLHGVLAVQGVCSSLARTASNLASMRFTLVSVSLTLR